MAKDMQLLQVSKLILYHKHFSTTIILTHKLQVKVQNQLFLTTSIIQLTEKISLYQLEKSKLIYLFNLVITLLISNKQVLVQLMVLLITPLKKLRVQLFLKLLERFLMVLLMVLTTYKELNYLSLEQKEEIEILQKVLIQQFSVLKIIQLQLVVQQ